MLSADALLHQELVVGVAKRWALFDAFGANRNAPESGGKTREAALVPAVDLFVLFRETDDGQFVKTEALQLRHADESWPFPPSR